MVSHVIKCMREAQGPLSRQLDQAFPSSCLIRPIPCFKTVETYCPRWELPVSRQLFFSNIDRSMSILPIGIPTFKNSPTTSSLQALSSTGNVLSFELHSLLNTLIMVWSFISTFSTSLCRFDASWTKYGFQNTFPGGNDFSTSTAKPLSSLTIKFSPGNCLTRSYSGTFVVSLFPLRL